MLVSVYINQRYDSRLQKMVRQQLPQNDSKKLNNLGNQNLIYSLTVCIQLMVIPEIATIVRSEPIVVVEYNKASYNITDFLLLLDHLGRTSYSTDFGIIHIFDDFEFTVYLVYILLSFFSLH